MNKVSQLMLCAMVLLGVCQSRVVANADEAKNSSVMTMMVVNEQTNVTDTASTTSEVVESTTDDVKGEAIVTSESSQVTTSKVGTVSTSTSTSSQKYDDETPKESRVSVSSSQMTSEVQEATAINDTSATKTGWYYDEAKSQWNYYDQQGNMLKASWLESPWSKKWFYFNQEGAMLANNWLESPWSEKWFYFNQNGIMLANNWLESPWSKKWFYFNQEGAMLANNWLKSPWSKKWFYFGQRGAMLSNTWLESPWSKKWFYFNQEGAMLTNNWLKSPWSKKWFYFGQDGAMLTNRWLQSPWNKKWFYLGSDGVMQTSTILWKNGSAYAFNSKGEETNLKELNSLVDSLGSNVTVAIQSEDSSQIYSYSNFSGKRLQTASTVKVAVLAKLLHQTGGNLTSYQRTLAEKMIRDSDNDATVTILNNYLGGEVEGLKSLYKDLKMTSTTPGSTFGRALTTPSDQLKLLAQIYLTDNSSYLNKKSQDYIKNLMGTVSSSQRWGISSGSKQYYLKNGWVTWNRNGSYTDSTWYVNSMGFIPNKGKGYTVAIFTYGNNYYDGVEKVEKVAQKIVHLLQ